MIATEIGAGDGLGNQLFRYITLRCMALDHGMDWGIVGSETMANNMHSSCGLYFMDLDYGKEVPKEQMKRYNEREDRIYIGNSRHDLTHGCYVTGVDEKLLHPEVHPPVQKVFLLPVPRREDKILFHEVWNPAFLCKFHYHNR